MKRGETSLGSPETDLYFNNAYEQTFSAVSRYVASHASRFQDAEDIIQNVYTRFYKRICDKGFDDIESAEAFLINIAKFECRTFLSGFIKRREKVKNMSDFSEEESAALDAELSRDEPLLEDIMTNKILAKQIFEDIIKNDDIVIKKAYFKEYDPNVGTDLESNGWGNIQTYNRIIDALKEKDIPVTGNLPDKEFMFGDFRVRFINTVTPQELVGKGENAASVGVLLEKGERTAFLAADFTAKSGLEKRYGDEIGHVDLLKIGHHGYFGSSSRSFIKKLSPKIAIVTNYLGKI